MLQAALPVYVTPHPRKQHSSITYAVCLKLQKQIRNAVLKIVSLLHIHKQFMLELPSKLLSPHSSSNKTHPYGLAQQSPSKGHHLPLVLQA